MRSLALIAATLLLGACAAESTDPEGAPAPSTCVRVETGAAPQAGRLGNKIWDDDWLAPASVGPQGCVEAAPQDDDTATRPRSLNMYFGRVEGEKQGAFKTK